MSIHRRVVPLALFLWCLRCAPPPTIPASNPGPSDAGVDGGSPQTGLVWRPCPFTIDETTPSAQCADLTVPLTEGSTETLTLRMKRILSKTSPATTQVWLVEGGPGGSSVADFAALTRGLHDSMPTVDLYAIDHRGVGGEARLECPAQESASSEGGVAIVENEWAPCVASLKQKWGSRLDFMSSTESAKDLSAAIEAVKAPNTSVILWGISYGTFELLRYLEFFPQQPSGVILEGITSTTTGFVGYDRGTNGVAEKVMAQCERDPGCSSHFAGRPVEFAKRVIASTDSGHCGALGAKSEFYRAFFSQFLQIPTVRDLLPAIVYRLDRCEARDVAAIAHLYHRLFDPPATPSPLRASELPSMPLFFHVALSEMWDVSRASSVITLQANEAGYIATTSLEVRIAARANDFPVLRVPARTSLPSYSGPLLMLQGALDFATPVETAELVRDHFTGLHQTWAPFPSGAHAVAGYSPTDAGVDCGLSLATSFISQPQGPLDLKCLQQTAPIDFLGSSDTNLSLLGTANAWDG